MSQCSLASDSINYAYVMKPLKKPKEKEKKGQGLKNFQVGEHVEVWGER